MAYKVDLDFHLILNSSINKDSFFTYLNLPLDFDLPIRDRYLGLNYKENCLIGADSLVEVQLFSKQQNYSYKFHNTCFYNGTGVDKACHLFRYVNY